MEMTGVRLFDGRGFSDGCSISVDGERVRHVECSGGANTADALVMPGLIDAHVHLHQIALFLGEAELQEVRDSAELIARLRGHRR